MPAVLIVPEGAQTLAMTHQLKGSPMPEAAVTDNTEVTEQQSSETETDEHVEGADDGQTFPAEYVQKLRKESAGYRDRAKTAEAALDAAQRQLFTARVAATGKLADADDLPYDVELLADEDALTAAIDERIKSKPHLAARKVSGSVGQGITGKTEEPFSLMGRLQQSV
jgi:hypothetical protein